MLSHHVYTDKKKSIGFVRQADIDEARYPELILRLAQNSNYISRADVVQLLHVSGDKAYYLLRKLAKDGRLASVNKGRYAKYQFIK